MKGAVDVLTGNIDDSNGAYWGESTHFLDPDSKNYKPKEMFVINVWGTTKGTEKKGVITFLEVARYQTTVFMKYNPKLEGSKIWL
ncbi:MAG: hypothetical protein GXO69_03595 [Acidobacteria bacterium]|nr:hypothetical protein [Acidobacteriota bacterium]